MQLTWPAVDLSRPDLDLLRDWDSPRARLLSGSALMPALALRAPGAGDAVPYGDLRFRKDMGGWWMVTSCDARLLCSWDCLVEGGTILLGGLRFWVANVRPLRAVAVGLGGFTSDMHWQGL